MAEPERNGPADRLERLEQRVNEMAQRQEQLMQRLGTQREGQAPMAGPGREDFRPPRALPDRTGMGQPMPPAGAPALADFPAPAGPAAAVPEQLVRLGRDITNARVLAVMSRVPRHEFVPERLRAEAYTDHPLPIGHGQTISQPYIVAFMTEQLEPKPTDRVLEIGTGSGYQAAVLAGLVAQVYTIEIIEELAERAAADLKRLGYTNAHVRAGDGCQGWAEAAPFDAIIITCAPERVPQPLIG